MQDFNANGWGFEMNGTPLLSVEKLVKQYARGWPQRLVTFELQADFTVNEPGVIGVMGANGAGKTTLFELMTGGNSPTSGCVKVNGQNIHDVRYEERARVAMHYHQSYQLRSFRRTRPGFMMERASSEQALVHLFDEPQFNAQDGYIGFMLNFFRNLRESGRVVFLCLHPNEPVHMEILSEVCERFIFVQKGSDRVSRLVFADDMPALVRHGAVRDYLGALCPDSESV